MSISGSLSSALSGLTVAARSAEVISSNIANALTEGYGRRDLQVSARLVGNSGQGAQVTGIFREVNQILMADRRLADASASNLDRRAGFLALMESAIGTPEEGGSLAGRLAAFDTALIAAAAQPTSTARHGDVAQTAQNLARTFQAISGEIQTSRSTADAKIATEVEEMNRALASIAQLNRNITTLSGGGRDSSALLDQRQQLVDRLATIVPIREVARDNGSIALFTTGGAILLDSQPVKLGFTPVGIITPEMTQASGGLSGLTINGRPIDTGPNGQLAGGSLAAEFAIRDQLAPQAQAQMDALARDLVMRLQDQNVDPSLAPGDAGLFTDRGNPFLAANEEGLAARLTLNTAVDPDAGGALWRLRDGIGAAAPGPSGQSALFSAMQTALTDARQTASGLYAGGSRSLTGLSGQLLSGVAMARLSAETEAGFSAARATALKGLELEGGVDTDRELQELLLVEQAYAANAKVIQTADDMIKLLLGL